MTTLLRSTPFLLSRHIPFRCLTPVTRSNDRTVMKRIATTVKFSTVHTDQVKTNLVKDVILYSNKNSRLHRNINIFGLTQLLFWVSLAEYSTYTTKKSHTGDGSEEVPNVKQNSEERKPENGFAQLFVGLGLLTLGISWIYSLRCVKNVVLRKGGKNLTLITYGPFSKVRYLDVPLEKVSAVELKSNTTNKQLPIKVKGYVGRFLIDMRGEIKNYPLFDTTVGVKRNLKQ